MYASTGTTWYSVAPPAVAPGLAIVTPTSIANSGGSATSSNGIVTFSGVNSISLNGVFTSANTVYRIILAAVGSTDGSSLVGTNFRLRAAGTDYTASTYGYMQIYRTAGAGTASGFANSTSFTTIGTHFDYGGQTSLDINNPATALNKHLISQTFGTGTAEGYSGTIGARILSTSAYDGCTIYPGSGTITGSVRVYAYRGA